MTDPYAVLQQIEKVGIIAGTRGNFPPEVMLPLAQVLMEESINIFELTMNSVQPLEAMQAVKQTYGEHAYVGMGTVLSVVDARIAMDAGADFIVSPAFDPQVVRYVWDAGTLMIPGIITPTEAVMAWQVGIPLLKVFPIGALGVEYFKAMFGALSHMRFMCNGAINQENARAFVSAGAIGAGVFGWLTGDGKTSLEIVRARALSLKTAIAQGKSHSG